MTISRKLLITGALLLGMQQITQAYDAHTLEHKTTQILNFTQTLRQTNHKDGIKVAQWLEQRVQVWNKSYNACDHDYDISIITNILNNDKLNIQSKISMLSQAMTDQKQKKSIIGTIRNCLGAALSIITGNGAL
jgi:hypothetical protein